MSANCPRLRTVNDTGTFDTEISELSALLRAQRGNALNTLQHLQEMGATHRERRGHELEMLQDVYEDSRKLHGAPPCLCRVRCMEADTLRRQPPPTNAGVPRDHWLVPVRPTRFSSFLPERPADRRALAHSHVHGGDSELAINGLRQALVGLTNLVDENGNHHDLVPKVAGHLKIVLERTAEREPEGAAHAHPQPSAFLLTVSCLRRPGDEPKFELDTSEMLILKDLTRPQKGRAKRRVWLAAKTALALRAALSSIG